MLEAINRSYMRLLDLLLSHPDHIPQEQSRILAIMRVGMLFGFVVHIVFMAVFFHLGKTVMAYYNFFSIGVFGVAWWLVITRHTIVLSFTAAWLIEMPLHATLSIYYFGTWPGFQLYILCVIAALPYVIPIRWVVRMWVGIYLTVLYGSLYLYAQNVEPASPMDTWWNNLFAALNYYCVPLAILLMAAVFAFSVDRAEERAKNEFDRAEGLLLNILPQKIAGQLKASTATIADEHPEATILFADIVGFTESSGKKTPTEVVERLNQVFSAFDELTEARGCEKIKTIGDAYMVVAGLPEPMPDHAQVIVELAKDMLQKLKELNSRFEEPIEIRIGINTGPVVAGVIGQTKFAYDLWGDAVNVASRMEQLAAPSEVRITETTYQAVSDTHTCIDKGLSTVKGKGEIRTYAVAV
ncbi:MAG: adenylate/guanylate cyclase domain-containing protein [Pseudomonadota bacterium]